MSLANYAATRTPIAGRCLVCALPEETRKAVEQGFADGYSAEVISGWLLAEHKVRIGDTTLKKHRRLHVSQ
jgi:hypothetical protein